MISYMPLMKNLESRGMQLCDLEDKLDLSRSSLRQVMNRGGYLNVSTLLNIAAFLQCDIKDLVEWKEGIGVENSTKFVSVDWQVLNKLCKDNGTSLSGLSLRMGFTKNKFIMARKRNSSMSPSDAQKVSEILGVEKEVFVR